MMKKEGDTIKTNKKINCLGCKYYAENDIQDWCLLYDLKEHEHYKHNHCPNYEKHKGE